MRIRVTQSGLVAVCLPVVAAGAGLRALGLRGRSHAGRRDLAMSMGLITVAVGGIHPKVISGLARVTGEPNAAALVSQIATSSAAGYGAVVLNRSAYSDVNLRARRREVYLAATLAAMGGCFWLDRTTPAELRVPTPRLFASWPSSVYWLTFTSYMSVTTGEASRLARRGYRADVDTSTRTGLQLLAGGTAVMAAQYAQFSAGVVGRRLSRRLPGPVRGTPALASVTVAGTVIAAGTASPHVASAWGAAHDAALRWRLERVWRDLGMDEQVLQLSVPRGVRSTDLRLYRRVVEVLDALDRIAAAACPATPVASVAAEVTSRPASSEHTVAAARAGLMRWWLDEGRDARPPRGGSSTAPSALADFRQEALRLVHAHRAVPSDVARDVASRFALIPVQQEAPTMLSDVVKAALVDAATQQPPCDCINDAIAGYLVYGMGQAAAEEFILESRDGCSVHGELDALEA